jgi:hypothetical protein
MYKEIILALETAALFFSPSFAFAADTATCGAYAKEAAAKAQAIREFNCGYDLNDPLWTTDRNDHVNWCRATHKHAVADEAVRRRGELEICQACRAYANLAKSAAFDNTKFECALSGPHWDANPEAHFGWCMALRGVRSAGGAGTAASYKFVTVEMEKSLHLRTAHRIQKIEECKLRQPHRGELPPKS